MIVVNFKTYPRVVGKRGRKVAESILREGRRMNVRTWVAVPVFDMFLYKGMKGILSQKVDPIHEGRGTGKVPVDVIKQYGFDGSVINHSENRVGIKEIRHSIQALREEGLMSFVCAATWREARRIGRMGPDFVVFEPPSLIATRTSVSQAKPDEIEKARGSVPLLVGAGIHSRKDVEIALQLGAEGVMVASHVAASKSPVKSFIQLAKGFR